VGLWLPYWSLSLVAVLCGILLKPGAWRALAAGIVAGAVLWGGLAWQADAVNDHILATRVGGIFGTSATGMVIITAAVGALLAGLGALLGDRLRRW
jgi:hypothetical protein